ncbi:MAG: NFACT family protein [Oscillospiraceae bacterium]|jgi:predicted ribosome quality control (RQC) complex YloA/Tae2 family protein|nr:NFACT family protein [Oscillospiraceae bacterium]
MPFDAIFLGAVLEELRPNLTHARVDKIQQPARDTLLVQLRAQEGNCKLLLCANVNRPRLHLTQASFENPAQPPMFCMLLRKHLSGARISALSQPPCERVVDFTFDCIDELGTPCQKHLILELMGRNSNLILTGADGRILDCLRRVDFEMSEKRQVLPGLFYHEPPTQGKRIPFGAQSGELQALLCAVQTPTRLDKWLIDTFAGLSPLLARELSFRFCGETDADICAMDRASLSQYLQGEFAALQTATPTLLLKDGQPSDFTFRDILQYGNFMQRQSVQSFSNLLDLFYTETDHADRMRQKSQTLRKAVTTLRERTVRKLALQEQELTATLDREQLRRCGDIVTANIYSIERGQTRLLATDFYDPDMKEIEIPLKPQLSPQQNAAKFYKDYAKAKHAEKILAAQIARGKEDAQYFDAVLDELSRAENERDLAEIRMELEAGGYVRKAGGKKQPRQTLSAPMCFRSSDGYLLYVGRNNRQNDELTFKTARKDDLWLHVQKFHGSHCVIACAGQTPSDQTITEAAMLAAYYSQARQGQNVPVDCTPVRYLRKPNGAKPGMVVYERYKTLIVTPEAALTEALKYRQG